MSRTNRFGFARQQNSKTARHRFRPAVVDLEGRTLLSSVLISGLSDPVGVTTDSAEDIFVSYESGPSPTTPVDAVAEYSLNSAGNYQYNKRVMVWTGPEGDFPGPLLTLGSSAALPLLATGDILEISTDGLLQWYQPSNGAGGFYGDTLTLLPTNASHVYDVQTGQYDDYGTVYLTGASFGDMAAYDGALLVSGESGGYDFILQVICTDDDGRVEESPTLLLQSPAAEGASVPPGLAVNASGLALTTLVGSSGSYEPIAFNALFNLGYGPLPEVPSLLGGFAPPVYSVGITVDADGDFVLGGLIGQPSDAQPGYLTISPNLVQYGFAPSTPSSANSPAPAPLGIAIPAGAGGFLFAVDNSAGEVLGDNVAMPSYIPQQIEQAYGVNQLTFTGPGGTTIDGDGAGQTIAIFDAGNDPTIQSDLGVFDKEFGIPAPPEFEQINNLGVQPISATIGETTLDVEWAHAIAPEANILLFDFNSGANSADEFTSLMNEIQYATANYPDISVVSISYGTGEAGLAQEGWSETDYDSVFRVPGVTFLVSSGDQGAYGDDNYDQNTTTFTTEDPASSPDVVAVGGTSLYLTPSGDYPGTGLDGEIGWSLGYDLSAPSPVESSGGGISAIEAEPSWQKQAVPQSIDDTGGRAVPDVAWDADSDTGFYIYSSALGGWLANVGGTSIATPQWAGLIAIADQERAEEYNEPPLTGYDQTLPALYSLPSSDFNNIVYGNNGYQVPSGGGYNLVTGLGSPIANLLVPALAAYESPLVVTAQPPSGVTPGKDFGLTITVEDGFGDVVTSYKGPVTISLGNNPGGATLGGTLTVNAINGVATFPALTLNRAGTGYTITASGSGLASVTTGSFNATAAAASKLVVTAEPPVSVGAGAGVSFTIIAEDPYGNVVTNFDGGVTATLPGATSGVTINATNGVADFDIDVQQAGTYTYTITSGDLTPATTTSVIVTPAAPAQLVVTTEPPSSINESAEFGLTITVEDKYGNVATSFTSDVTIALAGNPGGSDLGGDLTEEADAGVATFSGLTLDLPANGYTIQATGGSLPAVTTSAFDVIVVASQLVITTQPPGSVTAGGDFGLQVTAEDSRGNVASSFSGRVTIVVDNNLTLGGILTVTAVQGVAAFSELTLDKAGSGYSIQISAGALAPATTNLFDVTPAAAARLAIANQPSTATAGQPFSTQPVIEEEDQYGNIEIDDDSTIVKASLTSGAGPLQGMPSVTVSAGVADFANLADDKAETISLSFTSGTLESVTSTSVVVSPAAASQLVVVTEPPATATAGQAFAIQPVIEEEDQYGNLETGDNSTKVTAGLGSGAGPLQGTTTTTLSGGMAIFSSLADDKAETTTVEFAGASLKSAVSSPIIVSPAPATQLVIVTEPSATATAGQAFGTQPVIAEEDQYGNIETGDNGTVITASMTTGSGPLRGTTSARVSDGVATFANLTDDTAGTIGLKFSNGSLTTSAVSVTILPGPASTLVLTGGPPPNVVAGAGFGLAATIEDDFGNVVPSFHGGVAVSLANNPVGGALNETLSATVVNGVASFTGLALDTAGSGYALEVTAPGLVPVVSGTINVTPGPASQLVVLSEPPASVVPDSGFSLAVAAEDRFGNFVTSEDGSVAVDIITSPGGSLGGPSIAPLINGVATFSGLTLSQAGGYTLEFNGNGLATAVSKSINVIAPPTITGQQVLTTGKGNHKKPIGFELFFSEALNPARAQDATNYTVTQIVKHGRKTNTKPVALRAEYNPGSDSVSLIVVGSVPFTYGGEIVVNAAVPNGITDTSGTALDGNDEGVPGDNAILTVLPKDRGVVG